MGSVDTPSLGLRQRVARALPTALFQRLDSWVFRLRRARIRALHGLFAALGLNIARRKDYYSTLPVLSDLRAHRSRWDRPSGLAGLEVDVDTLGKRLAVLADDWEEEFRAVTGDYLANTRRGFGPGYPEMDARLLYYLLRDLKPRRYLEVGSGLSTYYASLAGGRNEADGSPLDITCIEPYPFDALRTLPGVELVESEVQDTPLEVFEALESGDVLFIDSSHALKVDSDVAYLMLEVLPRLEPGVLVHIHDIPFPFNTPYPADTWVLGERWPVYWNEAMVVQAFLAFNHSFEVLMSVPMVRHHDEGLLTEHFPDYVPVTDDPNPPSSLWLQRVL